MLIPPTRKAATDAWIAKEGATPAEKQLPYAHFNLLKDLTVRLYGSAANTGFEGSGVAVRVEGNNTHVLTAKHNLQILGNTGNQAPANFISFFKERITAQLANVSVALAKTATITVLDDDVAGNGYDAAVIQINDRSTADAVRALATEGSEAGKYTPDEWRTQHKAIVKLANLQNNRLVLANGMPPSEPYETKPKKRVDAAAGYTLLHFGYGMITKPGKYGGQYKFSYRALPIADLAFADYIPRTHDGYDEVFVFPASDDDTGNKGDSGGPVFAVNPAGDKSFLVGLYHGANLYADRTDDSEDSPTTNNAVCMITTERLKDAKFDWAPPPKPT